MSNRRDADFKPNSEDEDSMDQFIDNLENSIIEDERNKKAHKVEKRKRMPAPTEKLNIKDYEIIEAEEAKKPKKKAKVDSDPDNTVATPKKATEKKVAKIWESAECATLRLLMSGSSPIGKNAQGINLYRYIYKDKK
jgi:hypothetical protein